MAPEEMRLALERHATSKLPGDAIDEVTSFFEGAEDCALEDSFLDQVGGNAAERGGQIVKRLHVRISQGFTVDQKADLLAGVQATGQDQAFAQAQHNRIGKRDQIFFSSK